MFVNNTVYKKRKCLFFFSFWMCVYLCLFYVCYFCIWFNSTYITFGTGESVPDEMLMIFVFFTGALCPSIGNEIVCILD